MKIDKNKVIIPSVQETLNTFKYYNSIYPQMMDYDKVLMYLGSATMGIEKNSNELFRFIGYPNNIDASANMRVWIERNEDTSIFDRGQTGLSLSKSSIASAIESKKLSDKAIKLISIYQTYQSLCKQKTTLLSLLKYPISDYASCDGHRMLLVTPLWAEQNTGRVAMVDPAIQNFNREIQDIQTVPKGWILCHTDSGQIEPRETYSYFVPDKQIQALIRLYDDAYLGLYHYCMMPYEHIRDGKMDFVKMDLPDEIRKEGRQIIKTHGNAVMYGSKSNPGNDPVKSAMIERIGNHPIRIAKVNEIRNRVRRGEIIFETAFGTKIDISKSKKLENGKYSSREDQLVQLAINNPIQGTAADLMRYSVSEADRIIREKSPKSWIINYVHDAGTFAIYEDDFDKVKDELGNIVSYEVDGWLPIKAEPHFGRDHGKGGKFEDLY